MEKFAEPIVRTAFLALGIIVGGVCSLAYFTGDMAGSWATFSGAGAGAVITVMGVAWFDHHKANNEKLRKQRAAMFPLANALSEICRYSQTGIEYLVNLEGRQSTFDESLSHDTVLALKEATEWFDGNEGEVLGLIGPKYQLCRARSRGNVDSPNGIHRIEIICDFAELYAHASRLFKFSRGNKKIYITRQEIDESLFNADNGVFQWRSREFVQSFLNSRYGNRNR